MAGKKLATRIFLPQTRFKPTQKTKTEPTSDRLKIAPSVKNTEDKRASSVTVPCSKTTGIAEKMHPFPIDAVIIKITIASSKDLAARIV